MITKKILFVGAMKTELTPLLKQLNAILVKKLSSFYPFYKAKYNSLDIYIVETYVGAMNASIACFQAIKEVEPDLVIKYGCVGGSYAESKSGDIIVPLGFFHRGGWITKDKNTHKPTKDSSSWDSVFGEKDFQIQESRNNLGGMPYYFSANKQLVELEKKILKSLKLKYQTAFIGGGDMWMFDQEVLKNVGECMLPKGADHKRFVSDMESYALAHTCFICQKPFMGCYAVASNDYLNEEYNPLIVSSQMERLVPYALKIVDFFKLSD